MTEGWLLATHRSGSLKLQRSLRDGRDPVRYVKARKEPDCGAQFGLGGKPVRYPEAEIGTEVGRRGRSRSHGGCGLGDNCGAVGREPARTGGEGTYCSPVAGVRVSHEEGGRLRERLNRRRDL